MNTTLRTATLCGLSAAFGISPLLAQRGPVPGLSTATPYLIHYGNWTPTLVGQARTNYKLVILHPSASDITPADIAAIRSGPDGTAGTSDDVKVLAYISVGEDDRPGAPFADDGNGPRVDPRPSYNDPLTDAIAPLGNPSPGGTGFASYYLDDDNLDGQPDQNPVFGGYYVNPGDPAWYEILKTKTKAGSGRAGIQELLTTTYGAGYGCDGLFLDTLDTPAPNSFGVTLYEWTAKAYRDLVKHISDDNPAKLLLANRGVFFYNPNFKTYAYTLRPYINLLMFESYHTDSSGSGAPSIYFEDNKHSYAPKINAEANRPDGFTVIGLGYTSAGEPPALAQADFDECQREQGWLLYRTNPALNALPFNTDAATWNAANPDTSPPVWDSTAATGADSDPGTPGNQPPAPRTGIQQVVAADSAVTVRWDVARDQTGPVKYNIYYTAAATMDFGNATKIANVAPSIPANYLTGAGAGRYPYQFTVTGLANGTAYRFAVRAEDALGHEDTNTADLAATPMGPPSFYKSIAVDGNDADWADVPVVHTDPAVDGVPDIVSIKIANDADFIYLLVRYNGVVDTNTSNGSPSTFLSLDNDANPSTGFNIYGLGLIGAEVTWQNDYPFAQNAANYNLGATFGSAAGIAPYFSHTAFQEYRIRRDATYTIGGGAPQPVFSNNTMRFAFWSDHGTTAEFAGAVEYTIAAPPVPSHFSHIRVDGDFSDWAAVPVTAGDTASDGTPDIVSIKTANDDEYLYVLIGYNGATHVNNSNGAPSTFLSLDNDANPATGFNIYGLNLIGAEVSWQNDYPFAQSAGNYNIGAAFTDGAAGISPYATQTTWQEYRIRRDATYTTGGPQVPVFPNSAIRLAAWTDGSPAEFAGGFNYEFAANPGATDYAKWKHANFTAAELADAQISGDTADPDHDGVRNLMEFALGGLPGSADTSVLPEASFMTVGSNRHLTFTYKRPVAPSALTVTPEVSADLLSWDGAASKFVTVSTGAPSGGHEEVVARLADPVTASPCFVRLKVTTTP
ncbi:MAG: fibronectin type III domain-containing protein [Verrucomicrobia bacterium]|nr:fibronectin type III domain-containing protein [Verrucomicrobiota bacterium]